MQLHQVIPDHKPAKAKPRVGRGGKRGAYSGRGQKGQRAHAGRKIKPAVNELLSKLPKLKGYKNRSIQAKAMVINVGDLDKIGRNVINYKTFKKRVKILGGGKVKRIFKIEGLEISNTAKEKIEKAGGSVKLMAHKIKRSGRVSSIKRNK